MEVLREAVRTVPAPLRFYKWNHQSPIVHCVAVPHPLTGGVQGSLALRGP